MLPAAIMTQKKTPAKKAAPPPSTPAGPAVVFRKDGSIQMKLPGQTVVVPAPTVGQLSQIFEIDERYPIALPGDAPEKLASEWDSSARYMSEMLREVFGIEVAAADLPHWAVSFRVRRAFLDHWLTVPFDLPHSDLPQKSTAPEPEAPKTEPTPPLTEGWE